MRQKIKNRWLWYFISFFVVNVAQHALLYLLTLPLWTLHASEQPMKDVSMEILFPIVSFVSIMLVYFADTQLYEYVLNADKTDDLILNKGLWRYCRHPNYLLEQIWWWSIALWGFYISRQPLLLLGAFINSITLFIVTYMVEERMTKRRQKIGGPMLQAWTDYRARTGAFVPFWTKGPLPFEQFIFQKSKTV